MSSLQSIELDSYQGSRAQTTQSYTEANVKFGLQYELSLLLTSVPAGASVYATFQTGDKPVIIKGGSLQSSGSGLLSNLYKEPTGVSGGTNLPVFNLNDINPVPTTVLVTGDVSVTGNGTQISATTYGIGAAGGFFSSDTGSFSIAGIERVLAPNTLYLLEVTNLDADSEDIAGYYSWFEGTPDFPRPQNDN